MARQRRRRARVHGVSGTPPEELLDRGQVYRLAGDATAGFYRPRLAEESTDGTWAPLLPGAEGGPQLEGYAWGGLTSGAPEPGLLAAAAAVHDGQRRAPVAAPGPGPSATGSNPLVWLTWYLTRLLGPGPHRPARAGRGRHRRRPDRVAVRPGLALRAGQPAVVRPARVRVRAGAERGGLSVEHRLALGTLVPLLVVARALVHQPGHDQPLRGGRRRSAPTRIRCHARRRGRAQRRRRGRAAIALDVAEHRPGATARCGAHPGRPGYRAVARRRPARTELADQTAAAQLGAGAVPPPVRARRRPGRPLRRGGPGRPVLQSPSALDRLAPGRVARSGSCWA